MKKVILLITLLPRLAYGQIVCTFESGTLENWEQSPENRWKADTTAALSGQYSLHHIYDNSDASSDQAGIRTDSLHPEAGTATWSFVVKHGYDPSASNNWAVFVISDTGPAISFTGGNTHGFAAGVNLSGYDDTLRLWKVDGNDIIQVLSTHVNWQTAAGPGSALRIITERSPSGDWEMKAETMNGELLGSGKGHDNQLPPCKWLLAMYRYTSTRDRLFWLDELTISGIFHGNSIPTDTARAGTGEVVISEIMADPDPPVSLPACEYIEITNRTQSDFSLDGWLLRGGGTDYPFPGCTLPARGIMILCSVKDTASLSPYGKVTGFKQFPALTDAGKMLLLYDDAGSLIHGVEYSSDWYDNELKADGGWSLEMTDCSFPFFSRGNWKASVSGQGGTPGRQNSGKRDNPDDHFEGRITLFPSDSLHITLYSPEPLLSFPGAKDSITIGGKAPVSLTPLDPLMRTFIINLEKAIERKMIHEAKITAGLSDFAGNKPEGNIFRFGLAETASAGDVLFNELLFNPMPGDPDYIELFNASSEILDASRLELVSVNGDDTSSIYHLSGYPVCIFPGDYFAVTTDAGMLTARYPYSDENQVFEAGALPSMPDDKGHLILYSRELEKIDEVWYDQKMHSTLISGTEGIALEKIEPDGASGLRSNWRSASESYGWGTPGTKNSVYCEEEPASDPVSLSSKRITPDDDGSDDFLTIRFYLSGNTNVITVKIFDEYGYFLRMVAENFYAGSEASLIWDGRDDSGSMVQTGVYIVFVSCFDEEGRVHHWKKVCTVVR